MAEEGVPPADAGAESDASSGFGDSDDEGGGGGASGADEMMLQMAALTAESTAREGYKTFLATVPLLNSMGPTDIDRVADMVTSVAFADGDVIMRQGDEGNAMYILQAGKVAAEIESVGVVKEYASTDYFGEVALVRDGNKRAATVKSVGASTCLRLGVKPFHIVLSAGACGEMMRAHVAVLLGEGPAGIAESDGDSDDDSGASSGFGDSDDEGGGDSSAVSSQSANICVYFLRLPPLLLVLIAPAALDQSLLCFGFNWRH